MEGEKKKFFKKMSGFLKYRSVIPVILRTFSRCSFAQGFLPIFLPALFPGDPNPVWGRGEWLICASSPKKKKANSQLVYSGASPQSPPIASGKSRGLLNETRSAISYGRNERWKFNKLWK